VRGKRRNEAEKEKRMLRMRRKKKMKKTGHLFIVPIPILLTGDVITRNIEETKSVFAFWTIFGITE
jgi:hypothetical protein